MPPENVNAGDDGNTSENDAGQNKQAQQGSQQQQQNNVENNDDNFDDLWQNPVDETKPQQNKQEVVDTNKPDPEKTFNSYIEGLDLTAGIDTKKITEDLNQGNTEGLDNAFSAIAANTYRRAMMDMSKVIDQKVEAGVAKAVQQSASATQGDMAVKQMNTELQFTKNATIAPVASAVLAQLIKKGKSTEDAIVGVRKFFMQTSQLSAKELGRNTPPRNRPGNQRFDAPINNEDGAEDDIDWMETLGVG